MKGFYALYAAWLIACLGMVGSLYFSEIQNFEPCHLCWYQRICLYPLVFLLGLSTYHASYAMIPFTLPQVVLGFIIALYQVAIQENPKWQHIELCGAGPSCLDKIDIGLGPLTIPMLSALTFLIIIGCLLYAWRQSLSEHRMKLID
jgi:disulfide bond formation protein DsbB